VWIFKIDSNGDSLWAITYGGPESDYGFAVRKTADNGYIVTGQTSSFGGSLDNLCLLKTDENGDTLWTRVYGGDWNEVGISIEQTPDFGYIITGRFQINSYNHDLCLLKIEPDLSIAENEIKSPTELLSLQVHPNPFAQMTDIRYQITDDRTRNAKEDPSLRIYDACGRLVQDFGVLSVIGYRSSVKWDGTDQSNRQLASGVYFVKLSADDYSETKKVLLVR
jgi:hypothetical protein